MTTISYYLIIPKYDCYIVKICVEKSEYKILHCLIIQFDLAHTLMMLPLSEAGGLAGLALPVEGVKGAVGVA